MLYLIRSHGYGKSSILKIGYSNDLDKRFNQYFYDNPLFDVISTRCGDERLEKLLHLYLYYLGYQFKIGGKLNEWFVDIPEIRDIFHISRTKLERLVWRKRNFIFKEYHFEKYNRSVFIREIYKDLRSRYGLKKLEDIDKIYDGFEIREHELVYSGYGEVTTDEDRLAQDFLDNHFYRTGNFREKMKMYCEFMDKYKENQLLMDRINSRISDHNFEKYYKFYETSGCSARSYQKNLLERGIRDFSRTSELIEKIRSVFVMGEKYTKIYIKEKLQKIYDSLGIMKKAKASDIENYFEITRTNISIDGKLSNGFKLIDIISGP